MLTKKQIPKRKPRLTLIVSSLIICIPALYNNFPFIYGDTGTYIMSGFGDIISPIRPATYGIFMRHVSLHDSFWLVIFFQAILVAWSVRQFVLSFFKEISDWFIILIISVLTATTGIGITTGMLMPDFATSILILNVLIVLHSNWTVSASFLLVCLGLWFSVALHHSHFYILILLVLLLVVSKLVLRLFLNELPYRRVFLVVGIAFLGFLTIPTVHYYMKGEFTSNSASNVFLMGRFNQMGLLQPFLEEHCEEKQYAICKYKDDLPRDFLWNKKSPLNLEGGWSINNPLYKQTVHDFFSHPFYLKKFCIKTIETIGQQLVCFNTEAQGPLVHNTWQHNNFKIHMPDTAPELEKSLQSLNRWESSRINIMQKTIVFTSALMLIYLLCYQQHFLIPSKYKTLAFSLVAALFFNAAFCGSISMVAHRFQSRIIWILPLFVACLCYWLWINENRNENKKFPSISSKNKRIKVPIMSIHQD